MHSHRKFKFYTRKFKVGQEYIRIIPLLQPPLGKGIILSLDRLEQQSSSVRLYKYKDKLSPGINFEDVVNFDRVELKLYLLRGCLIIVC